MSDDQSGSDEAILQMVPGMCDLLGLKRLTPKRLVWRDSIYMGKGGSMPVPIDYPFISGRQLTLALRVQGVLTPEQWKPMLGSSLLVNSWARPRAIRTVVVGVIAALAYYVPVLFLAFGTNLLGSAGSFLVIPYLSSPNLHYRRDPLRTNLFS